MQSPEFTLSRNSLGKLVLTTSAGTHHEGVVPVRAFPISAADDGLGMMSTDGKELMKAMKELLKKKARPALYGLMRYELCRPLFQPLATFEGKTMKHLMLSDEKINLSALLGTLNLTR